jgi:hypothetical protein
MERQSEVETMAEWEEKPAEECGVCDDSAAIGVAFEICIQHAEDKKACELVRKKVLTGEIKTLEEMVEAYKKVTPEQAHPLLEEVVEWRRSRPASED